MSKTRYAWPEDYDFSNLFRLQEEIAQAAQKLSVVFTSDTLETIRMYHSYLSSLSLPGEDLMKAYAESLSYYHSFELPNDSIKQFAEALKLYNSPTVIEQMQYISSAFAPKIDPELIEAAASLDLSEFRLEDNNSLSFAGVQYTPEALHCELEKQVEIAKKEKGTLREKFEELKKKLWLVLLLLSLISHLPDIPEKVELYHEMVSQALEIAREKDCICFTIKEKNYLREEPNSNAAVILVLKYDTPLEILEDIPRWYQVKYTDESGLETIGWISKISVEMED